MSQQMYYSVRLGRRTYHALVIQKTHIIVVIMNTILGSESIVFSLNILCKTCECLPRIWSWKNHEKVMDFCNKKGV